MYLITTYGIVIITSQTVNLSAPAAHDDDAY